MVKNVNSSAKDDPISALRMFILEKNLNRNDLNNNDRVSQIYNKYILLSNEQKNKIIQFTAQQLQNILYREESIHNQLYSFCLISGFEKEFEHIKKLVEQLTENKLEMNLFKKICQTLFTIIDHEYDIDTINSTVAAYSLAFLIEIGIYLNNQNSKNKHDTEQLQHVIQYITSNLLARSNINNEEIRIALVYYLSRIKDKSQMYLDKILSRFGESLLESVFNKYFIDPKKNKIAFYFLTEHLNLFLGGSAYIAEMSNAVLQSQMLKNSNEFIIFFEYFVKEQIKEMNDYKSLTIHISFLLKKSFEINNNELIDGLKNLLLIHIEENKDINMNQYIEACDIIIDIISEVRTKSSRDFISHINTQNIAPKKLKSNKIKKLNLHSSLTNIHLENNYKKYPHPSALEEILLLAS
ncbi:hypothetical protein [Fluviispira multicolorata]|uniref:Uncharacterized protein n=1 Tax=Fluviispira multicolorata TaxID=2654512 RepID=A0A833N2B1_9BACT|nr:hypothetical protein [Fluviispira multicolorata]KAB8027982.1 hypothetical protein GCL57_13080 [Fluviispira multicolorata]